MLVKEFLRNRYIGNNLFIIIDLQICISKVAKLIQVNDFCVCLRTGSAINHGLDLGSHIKEKRFTEEIINLQQLRLTANLLTL